MVGTIFLDFKIMAFIQTRIFFLVFMAFANSGLFLIAGKLRIIDFYQFYRARWMPYCELCLFFWMAVIEVIYFITDNFFIVGGFNNIIEGLVITFICAAGMAAVSRHII